MKKLLPLGGLLLGATRVQAQSVALPPVPAATVDSPAIVRKQLIDRGKEGLPRRPSLAASSHMLDEVVVIALGLRREHCTFPPLPPPPPSYPAKLELLKKPSEPDSLKK